MLTLYRNGDDGHRGSKLVVSRRAVQNQEQLLRLVEELVPVIGGVRRLLTTDGRVIADVNQLFLHDVKVRITIV